MQTALILLSVCACLLLAPVLEKQNFPTAIFQCVLSSLGLNKKLQCVRIVAV